MKVSISVGNRKMGAIPSISLPSIVTCRKDCECCGICYAHKIERLRPTVRNAYRNNLEILENYPDQYWREVEAAIMMSRFFRMHVSGDIPDMEYLIRAIEVSERNPHCQILCFTKKYELVNSVLGSGVRIPSNLHLIFSGWRDLQMKNPYDLPEAHVLFKDGFTTAKKSAKMCGGNCTECAKTNGGCWTLKSKEQIVFNQH